MTTTLHDDRVTAALDRMYAAADDQFRGPRPAGLDASVFENGTAQERADALADIYMPISPDAGRLLYSLIRAVRPMTVIEFGMSYGISTIYLAAGVRDNGVGHVYTTEMSAKKIAAATSTLTDLGLGEVVTVLTGDALETLRDVSGPVGLVLLDGWKELYLPVLALLEPKMHAGSLVIADNTEQPGTKTYLDRVRDPANGYVSLNFPGKRHDTMELSCRVGD